MQSNVSELLSFPPAMKGITNHITQGVVEPNSKRVLNLNLAHLIKTDVVVVAIADKFSSHCVLIRILLSGRHFCDYGWKKHSSNY